jgi:hypothetical protein
MILRIQFLIHGMRRKTTKSLLFELDRRFQVLEHDEKLKQNVAPEIGISKLKF